jgi:hypothetical protein
VESLLYQVVEVVTAEFTVACATPVTEAFTGWTRIEFAGLPCGRSRPPADRPGRAARTHCPRTPPPGAPTPSAAFPRLVVPSAGTP